MTVPAVSFVPQALPLELYAGDGAALKLTLIDSEDEAIPLVGGVTAQVKLRREDTTPLLVFEVAIAGNEATLSLSGEQTASLGEFTGAWDVQWSPNGAEPVTLVQGKATCKLDVTR